MDMKYFSIEELCKSNTAKQLGIRNIPDEEQKKNLERLIDEVLDPIRECYNGPIRVNSGFRCERLNKVVGGTKTSQHLSGSAADIVPYDRDTRRLWDTIMYLVETGQIVAGQIIDEYDYSWIHISLPTERHRNEVKHIS